MVLQGNNRKNIPATKKQVSFIVDLVYQKNYKEPIDFKSLTSHTAGVLIHKLLLIK